jgi:hypothetical protein
MTSSISAEPSALDRDTAASQQTNAAITALGAAEALVLFFRSDIGTEAALVGLVFVLIGTVVALLFVLGMGCGSGVSKKQISKNLWRTTILVPVTLYQIAKLDCTSGWCTWLAFIALGFGLVGIFVEFCLQFHYIESAYHARKNR